MLPAVVGFDRILQSNDEMQLLTLRKMWIKVMRTAPSINI